MSLSSCWVAAMKQSAVSKKSNMEWNKSSSLFTTFVFKLDVFSKIDSSNRRRQSMDIDGYTVFHTYGQNSLYQWIVAEFHFVCAETLIISPLPLGPGCHIHHNHLQSIVAFLRQFSMKMSVFTSFSTTSTSNKTLKTLQIRISIQYSVLKVAECFEIYI